MDGSVVIGVVGGSVDEPRVSCLDRPQPVTDELLELARPVRPTEVFRFAAPCAGHGCRHFDGAACTLAARTAETVPADEGRLPPCAIRPRCRWFAEQGKHACFRCPLVVTENYAPTPEQALAATPPG
jgi:hypothetical protein